MPSKYRRPLLSAQSAIWFAQELEPDSPIFRSAECIEICGPIDPVLFGSALRQAVNQTDALHLRFTEDEDGCVWQAIEPSDPWQLAVVDVSVEPDPQAAIASWIRTDLAGRINLHKGPLFSYALFTAGPDHFYWYQGYHHILTDGVSCGLFAQLVAALYSAALSGSPGPAPTCASVRQLWDFDDAYRASGEFDRAREFWLRRFTGRPLPAVSLSDRDRPAAADAPQGAEALRRVGHLRPEVAEALATVAAKSQTSVPRVLLAATAAFLHDVTHATDIVLGVPVTGRPDAITRSTPGLMVNVIPLRVTAAPQTTVGELITRTSREVKEVMPYQYYRGEDLRRDLRLPVGHPRLFGPVVNIMLFSYRLHFGQSAGIASNVSLRHAEDLSISVYDRSDGMGIRVDFEANPARYGAHELAAHHESFLDFLSAFTGVGTGRFDAGTRLSELRSRAGS